MDGYFLSRNEIIPETDPAMMKSLERQIAIIVSSTPNDTGSLADNEDEGKRRGRGGEVLKSVRSKMMSESERETTRMSPSSSAANGRESNEQDWTMAPEQ